MAMASSPRTRWTRAVGGYVIRWRPSQELVVLITYTVGLYMTAVRRDDETMQALDSAPAAIADDYVLL
jgi:hypothetical protein